MRCAEQSREASPGTRHPRRRLCKPSAGKTCVLRKAVCRVPGTGTPGLQALHETGIRSVSAG